MNPLIPDRFYLVGYKGLRGSLFNKAVAVLGRRLDHGPYSHTELLFNSEYGRVSASSSYEDKGVRFKHIKYSNTHCWALS